MTSMKVHPNATLTTAESEAELRKVRPTVALQAASPSMSLLAAHHASTQQAPMLAKIWRPKSILAGHGFPLLPTGPASAAGSFDEADSTEPGDDTESVGLATSSDSESASPGLACSSDSEEAGAEAVRCVYSIAFLLRLRARGLRDSKDLPTAALRTQSAEKLHGKSAAAVTPSEQCKRLQGTLLPIGQDSRSSSTSSCGTEAPGGSSPASSVQTPSSVARQRLWGRPSAVHRSDDEKLVRVARSILNKITVERFEALFEQLATCGVKTPYQVVLLMQEIFEKATEQHHFIAMYADLCVRLEADSRLSDALGTSGEPNSFRRLLLGQCQSAFERLIEPPEAVEGPDDCLEAREERAARRKRRALGNVKLVGHLLVRGMLSQKLLVECSESLLEARASCPEALESLAALLTVAGPAFDRSDWQRKGQLEAIFTWVKALASDRTVPARLRFLLRDLLDLRAARWPQDKRLTAEPKGPMRLADVKRQAVVEEVPSRKPIGAAHGTAGPRAAGATGGPVAPAEPKMVKPTHGQNLKSTLGTEQVPAQVAPQPAAQPAPQPAQPPRASFNIKLFHRELSDTLRDLCTDRNVVAAVRRIRNQQVPLAYQCGEFVDILTRAAEEKRGPARRSTIAFAAGLMAAEEDSAFDRSKCLEGVSVFFREVYEELALEVPRLEQVVVAELLPTLRSVVPAKDLNAVLPGRLHAP